MRKEHIKSRIKTLENLSGINKQKAYVIAIGKGESEEAVIEKYCNENNITKEEFNKGLITKVYFEW